MYKAGQIITIGKKKYRITKTSTFHTCINCDIHPYVDSMGRYPHPCRLYCLYNEDPTKLIPANCNFTEVKPKTSLGKVSVE